MPIDLKSLSYDELQETMKDLGEKAFRGKQLYEWMHVHLARSYEDMTNIPKSLKEKLMQQAQYTSLTVEDCQISAIDGTRKY
ncbi:MAG: 23S rRNA (adenine(2503)-C(2))-methyltransferase RlmN, partial [Lachnospiraceae bacterium]|nr:23S rRNA (adenine(2503)-C(2))-methyltransferase RlmN [Lachnospiraceae bacterium]